MLPTFVHSSCTQVASVPRLTGTAEPFSSVSTFISRPQHDFPPTASGSRGTLRKQSRVRCSANQQPPTASEPSSSVPSPATTTNETKQNADPDSAQFTAADLPSSSKNALKACAALALIACGIPTSLGIYDTLTTTDGTSSLLSHLLSYSSHYEILLGVSVFGVLHSGLASLRQYVTDTYLNGSERLYRVVFALTSIPSAVLLVIYFILHRYDGIHYIPFHPSHNFTYGMTITAFLFLYPATFNLLEVAAIQKPTFKFYERAITRITRHPQLVGQTLWGLSHSLHLGSSFATVTALALVSYHCFAVWNGDRRLFRKYGNDWVEYAERTSIVPFAAVLSGKQKLVPREFLVPAYVGVILAAMGFYAAHPTILSAASRLL